LGNPTFFAHGGVTWWKLPTHVAQKRTGWMREDWEKRQLKTHNMQNMQKVPIWLFNIASSHGKLPIYRWFTYKKM
jgi:hypothetical protein